MKALLGLWALLAAPAWPQSGGVRASAGWAYEEYGFSPQPGRLAWAEAQVPVRQCRVLARGTRLDRFGQVDGQGSLGVAFKIGQRRGLAAEASLSPAAAVLPRFSTAWYLYQAVSGSAQLIPAYSFSDYSQARSHLASVGVVQPLRPWLELSGRAYLGLTDFKGGPIHGNPAVLASASLSPIPALRFTPSYSFRGESFEAGNAALSGRFHARTIGLRIGSLLPWAEVQAAFEYESRTNHTLLRRYELSVHRLWE